jgi:hypothetical protein
MNYLYEVELLSGGNKWPGSDGKKRPISRIILNNKKSMLRIQKKLLFQIKKVRH